MTEGRSGALQWLRLYGEPTRSANRDFLFKRLAWRVQELAYGGLGDQAKQRLAELVPDNLIRATTPNVAPPVANPASPAESTQPRRDPRLPAVGAVITKQYKGAELRVVVRGEGFEFESILTDHDPQLAAFVLLADHRAG